MRRDSHVFYQRVPEIGEPIRFVDPRLSLTRQATRGPRDARDRPLAGGKVTRPWGETGSTRAESNPDVDTFGNPLWLESDKAIVHAVERIAGEREASMAQIAMAWVLRIPVVDSPIIGATKPHHLADAVAALDIELNNDEVAALEAAYVPRTPTYFN